MIVVYETCKPVWIVRLSGRVTGDDLDALSIMVKRMHAEPSSLLLVDAQGVGAPEASIRTGLGQLTSEHEADGRDKTLGVSLLLSSAVLSGAVRAILWFVPGMDPELVKVVPDVDGALAHFEARAPDLVTPSLKRRVHRACARAKVVVTDT